MKNKLLIFILTIIHLIFSVNVYSGDPGAASYYIGEAYKLLSNTQKNAHAILGLYTMAMQEHPGGAQRHPYFKAVEAAAKQIEAEFQELNNRIKSLEQAANSHQAAATAAQNKLANSEQARAHAVAQYESLQKQATELHKHKETISLNLSNSQKLLEALNAEKSNLQKEKAQLSEQYNNTKATLEQQLIALENQKNAEANTLRQQIAQLAEEKNALIGKVQELEAISCENYKRLKNSERGAIEAIAERDAVIEKLESAQKERNRVMQEIEKKAEYILKHNLL